MAVVVPFEGHDIEVGTRYAYRYWLLEVQCWVAVDGEPIAEEVLASIDGQVLSGEFADRSGRSRRVRVEMGNSDTWRGHLPFVLFVDDLRIARGKANLGKHEATLFRAGLVVALVLAAGLFALWLATS